MTDWAAPQSYAVVTEVRIGAVITRSAGLFVRRAPGLLLISLLVAVPQIAGEFALESVSVWTAGTLGIIRFMTSQVAQIAMFYLILRELRGQPATVADSLGAGLRHFLPAVLAGLISGLLIGLGMILLVVPGVILAIMFSVAIPACMMERLGPVAALKRSAALTKGVRWQIFGLYCLLALVFFVLVLVAGLLFEAILAQGEYGTLVGVFTQILVGIVTSAIGAVLVSVLYNDLRIAREGLAGLGDLARVFD